MFRLPVLPLALTLLVAVPLAAQTTPDIREPDCSERFVPDWYKAVYTRRFSSAHVDRREAMTLEMQWPVSVLAMTAAVRVTSSQPAAGPALLLVGSRRQDLPMSGSALLVGGLLAAVPMPLKNAVAEMPVSLRYAACHLSGRMAGLRYYLQAAAMSRSGTLLTSHGLELTLGLVTPR